MTGAVLTEDAVSMSSVWKSRPRSLSRQAHPAARYPQASGSCSMLKSVAGAKPKVRAMDPSASSQPYASSSQDTTLTEALDDTEDTTEKDAALATLELQALPETEQDLDDRVRSMLRAVMKRPRSSSQPHGPTAAAVRMQADTRAKEITGARNVLRDAIRSGGK
jgi:hypothetical protein